MKRQVSAISILMAILAVTMSGSSLALGADATVSISGGFDTYLGDYVVVSVNFSEQYESVGYDSLDLLIEYDPAPLTFIDAEAGDALEECGWEYFSYATAGAPAQIQLTAVADVASIPGEPLCHLSGSNREIARLRFFVTNDATFDCLWIPVAFLWADCGDNTLRRSGTDSLYYSEEVFDYFFAALTGDYPLPSTGGAPDSCLALDDGVPKLRNVDFIGGGVDIICSDSIDVRGDLNLNNIANEIADWVLYTSYFIYGLDVFNINVEAQVAASEINGDGVVLTVRDLTYMYRIIVGDALPIPKPTTPDSEIAVFLNDTATNIISLNYDGALAAALIVLSDSVEPTLDAELSSKTASFQYDVVDSQTRILIQCEVFPEEGRGMSTGPILTYEGEAEIVSLEVSDYYDNEIQAVIGGLPLSLDLEGVILLINYIFEGTYIPYPLESGDINCDGIVDIDDVTYLIAYLFAGGPDPYINCP
jgi:hypothetical protein